MKFPEISVIGTGGLGTVLTKTLSAKGITVKSIFNRTENKAEALASSHGIEKWGAFPSSLDDVGSLIFITVSDSSIEAVAGKLAQIEDKATFKERTFVHCSGNESADLLEPLKSKGATVASFHPLQTFTSQSKPDDFEGIYFSMQGDSDAFPILKSVAAKVGARTLEVTKEQKSQLHAAAVMASNYLVTLLNASAEIGALGDLTDTKVKEALLPLVRTTLENTADYSYTEALTGPIKRGDVATVEKHLKLLDDQDELKHLYCVLGLHTVELVGESGHLDGTTLEKLRKLFRQ